MLGRAAGLRAPRRAVVMEDRAEVPDHEDIVRTRAPDPVQALDPTIGDTGCRDAMRVLDPTRHMDGLCQFH